MKEFECPECGEMIPGDSKYCDMCGAMLLKCINCGAIGTGDFCPECGKPMVSRKVSLVLKYRDGNISLQPEDEATIGRSEGAYAPLLSALNLISRRHGKFVRRDSEWYIVDFGSTNGTYVNDREVPANTPVKIAPGDVVDIGTYIFDAVEK